MAAHPGLNYLRSMLRIAAREVRARDAEVLQRGERLVVEWGGLHAAPRHLARYLHVTGGAEVAALRAEDAPLPPLYPTTWEARLALELLCHPRAPSVRRGVVHLESEVLVVRPLRRGDTFRCRLELDRLERDPRGVRLHLLTRTWNASGQLGTESRTVLLARGGEGGSPDAPRPLAAPPAGHDGAEVARWALRTGHSLRYARASGDYNPIHLSRLTALPFGFRRPILHGFCTAALAAHALIQHRLGGEPARLRRLRIAFRRPLLLPAEVRLVASGGVSGPFRVIAPDGAAYAEGEFGAA